MIKIKLIIILGLVLIIGSIGVFALAQLDRENQSNEAKKGLITYVEGTAKKRPPREEEWLQAYVNTSVATGEKVKTLRRSRAEIELSKGSIIRLAERTTVDIVKLYDEEKEKSQEETLLNVEEGDIWGNVSKLGEDSSLQISTDVSVSAIRGTVFGVNVGADTTRLRVYTGEVEIKNSAGQKKQSPQVPQEPRKLTEPVEVEGPKEVTMEEWIKIVQSMQEVVISHDQPWSWLQRDFSKRELSDWEKWNQERDDAIKDESGE